MTVAENDTIVSRRTQVLLRPLLCLREIRMIIGRSGSNDINIIMLYQIIINLIETRLRFAIHIGQCINTDIDDAPFPSFLLIIHPTDNRYHAVHQRSVIQPMNAVEMYCVGIMTAKQVKCMYCGVFIAEETIYALLLLGRDIRKTLFRNILIFLDQGFRDDKLLHTVCTQILKRLLTHHIVFVHCFTHLKGRIH